MKMLTTGFLSSNPNFASSGLLALGKSLDPIVLPVPGPYIGANNSIFPIMLRGLSLYI